MDVNNEPASQGSDKGKPDAVNLEEQNRGLMQGMMAERDKRHALEREVSELRGQMNALNKQATQPKTYTSEQLASLVEDGKMDQATADRIKETQLHDRVTAQAREEANKVVATQARNDRIAADLEAYMTAKPELNEAGSAARSRVEREFQYLVSLGDKPDKATELKACRAVYGPVDSLQQGTDARETHQETGGGDSQDTDSGGSRGDDAPKTLTAAQRAHYKPLVGKLYKDWSEVEAELKYADPRLVKRYANR